MPYDADVTSSVFNVEVKRRVERIDFERPPVVGAGSLTAKCYMRETTLNSTPGSPKSGSVLMESIWLVEPTRGQILGVSGAGAFLNGMVALTNDLRNEFESSGSLATGSIAQLS